MADTRSTPPCDAEEAPKPRPIRSAATVAMLGFVVAALASGPAPDEEEPRVFSPRRMASTRGKYQVTLSTSSERAAEEKRARKNAKRLRDAKRTEEGRHG